MYVIHLGVSGYPGNSAPMQRIRLTFKGLKLFGFNILILNKHSINITGNHRIQRFDGIPFVFTSLKIKRPYNFIIRRINKLSGNIGEIILLIKKRKKIHAAILYTPSFVELIYYRIISKLLGFKMILQYVELRSSLSERNNFFNRISDRLFDSNFHLFCDGVIAISDFLIQHIKTKSEKLPVLKIPAMCDFKEFNFIQPYVAEPYLMFCGSIIYSEVIEFILDLFITIKSDLLYEGNLLLIISGEDQSNWNKINKKINSSNFKKNILIKSNIAYSELLSMYKGADILLIPLRNTIQDRARFPHKIGEYSASKRPILSTNLGEPKIYFKDSISAILADTYSLKSYLEKLSDLLPSKERLDKIGMEGYHIGLQNFDHASQAALLKKFILVL